MSCSLEVLVFLQQSTGLGWLDDSCSHMASWMLQSQRSCNSTCYWHTLKEQEYFGLFAICLKNCPHSSLPQLLQRKKVQQEKQSDFVQEKNPLHLFIELEPGFTEELQDV